MLMRMREETEQQVDAMLEQTGRRFAGTRLVDDDKENKERAAMVTMSRRHAAHRGYVDDDCPAERPVDAPRRTAARPTEPSVDRCGGRGEDGRGGFEGLSWNVNCEPRDRRLHPVAEDVPMNTFQEKETKMTELQRREAEVAKREQMADRAGEANATRAYKK